MHVKPDPVAKYHKTIESLTREAEADKALDLAIILETVSSGILFGVLPALAATCLELWKQRTGDLRQPAPESRADATGAGDAQSRTSRQIETAEPSKPRHLG